MRTVLHVLPHSGGGAETYLRLLAEMDGFEQRRIELAAARTPRAAAPSIVRRLADVRRQMREVDLVHVHGDAALLLMLPLLRRRPAVWTTHGLHLLRRRRRLAPLVRSAMRRVQFTICTSGAEARELAAIGGATVESERLRVVPNGVPLPGEDEPHVRAAVRAELGLREHDLAVLFLGELEQRKRPLDAVAAAEMARAAGAPVTLLVAGRGPLQQEVQAHAGVAVRALGHRDDAPRLLAASDAFVLPSTREGHSFALLEAMAHGLPAVVSDGAGNAEAVAETGVVVAAGDRKALARALAQLAQDPERRRALGVAARERVARELTPERLRDGVRESYEQALARAAR